MTIKTWEIDGERFVEYRGKTFRHIDHGLAIVQNDAGDDILALVDEFIIDGNSIWLKLDKKVLDLQPYYNWLKFRNNQALRLLDEFIDRNP